MCIRSIWRIRFIWCILFCSIYLYITAPCCVWLLYRWRNVAHFANSFIIHKFCVTHIWLDLNFVWNINDCICLNTYIYSSIRWNGINSFDVWLFLFMCYVRSLFGFVFTEFRYAFVLNKHYHLLYSWLVCWCRDVLLFIVCGYILLFTFFYVLFFSFSYVLFNELACRLVWFGLWQCAPSPQRIHRNIMGEKWRMEKTKHSNQRSRYERLNAFEIKSWKTTNLFSSYERQPTK